jgi:hypothetical protein
MHSVELTDAELSALNSLVEDPRRRRPSLKMAYGVTWAALERKGLITALDCEPWFSITPEGAHVVALMRGEYELLEAAGADEEPADANRIDAGPTNADGSGGGPVQCGVIESEGAA